MTIQQAFNRGYRQLRLPDWDEGDHLQLTTQTASDGGPGLGSIVHLIRPSTTRHETLHVWAYDEEYRFEGVESPEEAENERKRNLRETLSAMASDHGIGS